MPVTVRKSEERGHASLKWLESHHTFSFANYYDNKFLGFHSLKAINEDRVAPREGFGTHHHSEMEIFSYILSGAIEHKDSMGNSEILTRGGVQFTSAGTGIQHSEFNASDSNWTHLLQIWVRPNAIGLKPGYQTKIFSDEEKRHKLKLIVSPDGSDNSIIIHQDIKMFASILNKGEKVTFTLQSGRAGYIHVADTHGQITINDTITLCSGDGAFVVDENDSVQITSLADNSEFVVFDIHEEKKQAEKADNLFEAFL